MSTRHWRRTIAKKENIFCGSLNDTSAGVACHSGSVSVAQRTRLRSHNHQIGPDAGSTDIRWHHTTCIAESSLDGKGHLLRTVRRNVWRQSARWTEGGADSFVVVRSHFWRQIGSAEELVEKVVDVLQLLRRTLDEHTLRILTATIRDCLLLLHGPRENRTKKETG